jgi:hypothetical protein
MVAEIEYLRVGNTEFRLFFGMRLFCVGLGDGIGITFCFDCFFKACVIYVCSIYYDLLIDLQIVCSHSNLQCFLHADFHADF